MVGSECARGFCVICLVRQLVSDSAGKLVTSKFVLVRDVRARVFWNNEFNNKFYE